MNGVAEPALDLLEAYLAKRYNLTNQQKDRWAGEYPLTVLMDALRFLYARLGYPNVRQLVAAYPKIAGMPAVEDMLRDIGLKQLTFKILRDSNTDFALNYGVKPVVVAPSSPTADGATTATPGGTAPGTGAAGATTPSPAGNPSGTPGGTSPSPGAGAPKPLPPAPPAYAINDPRRVKQFLKKFSPSGVNRSKVITLLNELNNININKNPIAFCFLLRSILEISSKA